MAAAPEAGQGVFHSEGLRSGQAIEAPTAARSVHRLDRVEVEKATFRGRFDRHDLAPLEQEDVRDAREVETDDDRADPLDLEELEACPVLLTQLPI